MKHITKETQNGEINDGSFDVESSVQTNEKSYNTKCDEIIKSKVERTNNPDWDFEQSQIMSRDRRCHDAMIKDKLKNYIKMYGMDGKFNFDDVGWNEMTEGQQRQFIEQMLTVVLPALTPNLINISLGTFYYGDCGRSPTERPDWLDLDKFLRGQKFARDHLFGISYASLLSLFTMFSFDHGLEPLIITKGSSTPYTSFKRYLSTGSRVRNWYTENPWEPGTAAYKDIQAVRKLHCNVRTRISNMTLDEIHRAVEIKNPMCPAVEMLRDDLRATCPAPAPGQCPYAVPDINSKLNIQSLNQGEMSSTQFSFFGLALLYPHAFGIHNAREEDFEAFCHTWKGLGYLLGIDDEFNFCRGTLDEIRQRCRDFLYLWVKPNFREITPQSEHMMRCILEGMAYYFPGSTYETTFLYLTDLMDLHMPRLYNSLSYSNWIRYNCLKFFFHYTARIPGLHGFMNKILNNHTDKALKFNQKQLAEFEKRSIDTLNKLGKKNQTCSMETTSINGTAKQNQIIVHHL